MSHYRVRIRHGDAEVEVESSEKNYVEAKLKEIGALVSLEPAPTKQSSVKRAQTEVSGSGKKARSLAEHVRALSPKDGVEYVIAVGDHLEHFGGKASGFKTKDISKGFKEVKFKYSNPAEAVRKARQQGYLMNGTDSGTMQLTQSAEAWVRKRLSEE